MDLLPSQASIYRALVRNSLIQPRGRRRRHQDDKRWERSVPMQLWRMDITGQVMLADGLQAKLITGVDDHSRYCVIARVVEHATGRAVYAASVQAMQRYGVPGEVLTDNGKQFTGRFGRPTAGEVLFERICRENGITQRADQARLAHHDREGGATPPDRAGRAAGRTRGGRGAVPEPGGRPGAGGRLVQDDNLRRPHQALGMRTPAERFRPGQRHPGAKPGPTADAEAADDHELLALRLPAALDPAGHT